MTYRPKLQLPPPAQWADFESLCWGLWKAIWGDSNAQKNGRQGQPQHGVDIFGQPANGTEWAAVQCKGKENFTAKKLTKTEVTREVAKAKKFKPRLTSYIVATTAPKDSEIQEHARKMTDRHKTTGWFRVAVCGWDDIEDLLYDHEPPVARQFYPLVFGGELGGLLQKIVNLLPEPSDVSSISPAEPNFAVEVTDGMSPRRPSSAGSAAGGQARARDVRCVLPFLSSVQRELDRQSEQLSPSSSDATLASAVGRALRVSETNRRELKGNQHER